MRAAAAARSVAAIVPTHNLLVKLEIVGRPSWWILLPLVPLVNLVVWITFPIDRARSFGREVACGVGLALLPFFLHPMPAFGTATYQGPAARSAPPERDGAE